MQSIQYEKLLVRMMTLSVLDVGESSGAEKYDLRLQARCQWLCVVFVELN